MSVKEHYDNHLGNFYSWMIGDFEVKQKDFQLFMEAHNIVPSSSKIAIDLGSGHGIQSVALAKLGFSVKAVDFNPQLLNELKANSKELNIEIIVDDIRNVIQFKELEPELIICLTDTLLHLDNRNDIEKFINDACSVLNKNGKVILSFRDYSTELIGDGRFVPVKSDETKILTCMLEYFPEFVRVTDLLHEKTDGGWKQKISSYNKVRLSSDEIKQMLNQNGMTILFDQPLNRVITIIANKL